MGLDLLYRNLESMSVLNKTRNLRKVGPRRKIRNMQDLRPSSPCLDQSDDVCKSSSDSFEDSDSPELLCSSLQYMDISNSPKKPKNILPVRPMVMASSEGLNNECEGKYSKEPYYSGTFLWNSMINNFNYEKNAWSDSNWASNDWNGVGSDLTTNSGTVNSLNEEKNSDIFQNTNSSNSSNENNNFTGSKSLSSQETKNFSTAETTPETMVTNVFQGVNVTSLNGCQFPSILKSSKDINSFLNNHPPLSSNTCNYQKEEKATDKPYKSKRDVNFERDFDASSITQSNGPPVTMKICTSWNGDSENTTSVKKSEKVQLVARAGDWIYVRVNSNPNRYGWIPEFTLVESEMLSRKMTSG